jgi:hypothetical protein
LPMECSQRQLERIEAAIAQHLRDQKELSAKLMNQIEGLGNSGDYLKMIFLDLVFCFSINI